MGFVVCGGFNSSLTETCVRHPVEEDEGEVPPAEGDLVDYYLCRHEDLEGGME
jgi:hypothetical protein